MSYEAWRITYQSSEQAARAAYTEWQVNTNRRMTMCLECSADEFAITQEQETVAQEADGVTVRMATITCRCGWKRSVMKMYKCLYCGEWLCEICAEAHFGKTREQYKAERHKPRIRRDAIAASP